MAMPLSLVTDRRLGDHVTVLTGANDGKYPDGNSVLVAGTEGAVLIDPSLTVHGRGGVPGDRPGADQPRPRGPHRRRRRLDAPHVHAHHDDVHGVRSLDGLLSIYGLAPDGGGRRGARRSSPRSTSATSRTRRRVRRRRRVRPRRGRRARAAPPGHTRGHSAFVVEPDGVAFVGDVDLTSFGPYYGDHWSDLEDFVDSLARVRELDAQPLRDVPPQGRDHRPRRVRRASSTRSRR